MDIFKPETQRQMPTKAWQYFPWRLASKLLRREVTIFAFHRFACPDLGVPGHDPRAVRGFLEFLKSERIPILGLAEVVSSALSGQPHAQRGVVLTVDDAYSDFNDIGLPIFSAYDCPSTLFVPTGFIDGSYWFWWDRLDYAIQRTTQTEVVVQLSSDRLALRLDSTASRASAIQSLGRLTGIPNGEREQACASLEEALEVPLPSAPPPQYAPMSWAQIRAGSHRGVSCGPHTVNHPIIWTTPAEMMKAELNESYRKLAQEAPGNFVPILAYPQGCVSRREVEFLPTSGIDAAVLSFGGSFRPQSHFASHPSARYLIPRQGFENAPHRHRQSIVGLESFKMSVRRFMGRAPSRWENRTPDGKPPVS